MSIRFASSLGSTTSSDSNNESTSLHAAIWSVQTTISDTDANIVNSALELLVECVCARPDCLQHFYNLPHLSEWLVDLLLVNNEQARKCALTCMLKLAEV